MKMIINYNFDFTMEGEHKDMMQEVFGDGDITFYVSDESKKRLRESIKALEYKPKIPDSPPNRWAEHVKTWGKENGISYWKALRHPDCKKAYNEKKKIKK